MFYTHYLEWVWNMRETGGGGGGVNGNSKVKDIKWELQMLGENTEMMWGRGEKKGQEKDKEG